MTETINVRPTETANCVAIPSNAWQTLPAELKRQGIEIVRVYKGIQALHEIGAKAFLGFLKELDDIDYDGPCFVVEAYDDAADMHRLACAMYEPQDAESAPEPTPFDKADAAFREFQEITRELGWAIEDDDERQQELAKHDLLAMWPEIVDVMDEGISFCQENEDYVRQTGLEDAKNWVASTMRHLFPTLS